MNDLISFWSLTAFLFEGFLPDILMSKVSGREVVAGDISPVILSVVRKMLLS